MNFGWLSSVVLVILSGGYIVLLLSVIRVLYRNLVVIYRKNTQDGVLLNRKVS